MQLTTLLLAALSAVSVSASPSWMGGDQVTIQEEYKVPGDNPLYFCGDPANDLLKIEKVDLSPNPPKPGETLSIKATGDFKEEVGEGFTMHLQVKYGIITLINQNADGCETIKKGDLECPLKKGEMSLTKDVDLPREIPPGQYTVLADVLTKDGDKITCLTAKIAFHRGDTEDSNTGSGSKVKFGQPRVQMSGPLAGLVQERLRRRNEL
ncbi:hypothetical protein AA0117_g899 [Alternaria alternata]|uniref:Phosphatidylglycerol/phosphatidylinositol transfer protein n=5 Tax=Alternaria sect. Alternaria TaxID=2499237 RepID=A0A4Q4NSS9_ALTAL|nr:hypothetical protein AA0114_g11564 [Alternaria tenuissima]RYN83061.1 hypothetical protein AA0117_g899 [Alternaria alternata]RYO01810.1 hypothetical protein AA0120_g771 [Alternaria tenuissima]